MNFKHDLENYVRNNSPVYDSWNNPMVNIPFYVTSISAGNITVEDFTIIYNYSAYIDALQYVYDYVSKTEPNGTGFVSVPLTFSSTNVGKIFVKVYVSYSATPPWLKENILDVEFDEDNAPRNGLKIINLDNYFTDDKDAGKLQYVVRHADNKKNITARIDDTKYLSFVSITPDWSGTEQFIVIAMDTNSLTAQSNIFNVTVKPINDVPLIYADFPSRIKVLQNIPFYLNLSTYIFDKEDGTALNVTVSDTQNIQVIQNPLQLKILYAAVNQNFTITMRITDKGEPPGSNIKYNETNFTVEVKSSDNPLWNSSKKLPDIVVERNHSVTTSWSLFDYLISTRNPSTLDYSIVNQRSNAVNILIYNATGKINVTFNVTSTDTQFVGFITIYIRVSYGSLYDALYDDTKVIIRVIEYNYVPIYLGGIEEYNNTIVDEDSTWSIDLSRYFYDPDESSELVFSSNYADIKISRSIAIWQPHHGSASLFNLTFTAIDSIGQKTSSTPINLLFREINDAPQYLFTLQSSTVIEGQTWEANLSAAFTDEETPYNLNFKVNYPVINITQKNGLYYYAIWRPDHNSTSLRSVVFTATDPEGKNSSSFPINLIFIKSKIPPIAIIDEPKNGTTFYDDELVTLIGRGLSNDSNISEYLWQSSIDGYLGNNSTLSVRLSIGTHIISFKVKDSDGNWSNDTTIMIYIVEQKSPEKTFLQKYGLLIVGVIIFAGFMMHIIGRSIVSRKR